ncbi:hypothetical protein ACIPXU_18555, partial [Streptomyces sp. NPDC090029]
TGRRLAGRRARRGAVAAGRGLSFGRLLRAPGGAPGLPARGGRLRARRAGYDGLLAVGGQHDALVRGPRGGRPLLVTLSAVRHRDSYVWAYGIVGSRYRVAQRPRTRVQPW